MQYGYYIPHRELYCIGEIKHIIWETQRNGEEPKAEPCSPLQATFNSQMLIIHSNIWRANRENMGWTNTGERGNTLKLLQRVKLGTMCVCVGGGVKDYEEISK